MKFPGCDLYFKISACDKLNIMYQARGQTCRYCCSFIFSLRLMSGRQRDLLILKCQESDRSCICVLGVMYMCVRGHVYVLGVMYKCARSQVYVC